jgi:type I restriction-modification system DNA methylase subunit
VAKVLFENNRKGGTNMVVSEALNLIYTYLHKEFRQDELKYICRELKEIARVDDFLFEKQINKKINSYNEIQEILSKLNEKESIRKNNGVYYTPSDVVRFILINSIKSAYGKLSPNNIHKESLEEIPYLSFCLNKIIFDPTCGAGEFLLAALELKFDMFEQHKCNVKKEVLKKAISTIRGNDINIASVIITKLRLFLCALQKYGVKKCIGLCDVLNDSFVAYDFVTKNTDDGMKYNIIIGNPPYVEDSKSGLNLSVKYGNIYANVLKNAAEHLYKNGCMGFIIPLSYISTPRMKAIRKDLSSVLTEQYILSYADRPDCLFDSVHQKTVYFDWK